MEKYQIYSSPENEELIMKLTAMVLENRTRLVDAIDTAEMIYVAVKMRSVEVNE